MARPAHTRVGSPAWAGHPAMQKVRHNERAIRSISGRVDAGAGSHSEARYSAGIQAGAGDQPLPYRAGRIGCGTIGDGPQRSMAILLAIVLSSAITC